jgi:DNA polymerase III delta prime subunit
MTTRESIEALRAQMAAAIVDQSGVIERLLIGLLANGNLLVEGLPGLAKTRAIKALARNLEAQFSRIQFTPDLLPLRRHRDRGLPPGRWPRRVPLRAGADLRQHRAGRRDHRRSPAP